MNKATKAALYSALLFPGCGQMYLKHHARGMIFALSVLAGTFLLAWIVISAGAAIIHSAPFKKGTVQIVDVISVVVKSFQSIDLKIFLLMVILLLILWVLSIWDAYLLGTKQAAQATTDADPESASNQR